MLLPRVELYFWALMVDHSFGVCFWFTIPFSVVNSEHNTSYYSNYNSYTLLSYLIRLAVVFQSATLTNGVLTDSKANSGNAASSDSPSDSDSDNDEDKFKRLTDEELFKACGGLTAHK
jgi:hypothetical protein